jgi:transposase-like protein
MGPRARPQETGGEPLDERSMEEAVHAMIAGEASLEALAEKYGVDTHTLWAWKDGYTSAGRRALAAMRDAARRGR